MESKSKVYAEGVDKKAELEALEDAIKNIFLKATDDLSWLKEGEFVLLKPALNSHDPYPATTHPLCLKVVSEVLEERGARVIVGDQSGIEHVVMDSKGVVFGSSHDCFRKSGMSGSGVEFLAFEDRGWNGFRKFISDKKMAWKNGFYITKVIDEVDHIINLPRVSSHAMGGVTLGFKNLVGLLREDSRIEFHQDGPFSLAINMAAKRSKFLKTNYENEGKFFEKMVEISLAVQNKLRLTLFVATSLQCTLGPDRKVVPLVKSYVSTPDVGLVFASSDQISADAFALAFLILEYERIPLSRKIINKVVLSANKQVRELGKESLWENRFLKSALELNLGNKEFAIENENVPKDLMDSIKNIIRR